MERRVFRNEDFSLSEEQEALRSTLAAFFAKECPTTVVRKAEPLGFDADLWGRLVELGVVTMGVPEPLGGDGAGLVELALAPRSTVARWRPCRSSSRWWPAGFWPPSAARKPVRGWRAWPRAGASSQSPCTACQRESGSWCRPGPCVMRW